MGVCSLTNYSVANEEAQSNRASGFRDFVCSLFPKAILFDFYFKICITSHRMDEMYHFICALCGVTGNS